MKIAVLFDGAGLARLGLERAGHQCTGVELDPWKHYLSQYVGSGNCVLGDATTFDISGFDAVWASPPCQTRSVAADNKVKKTFGQYSTNYLEWCLKLDSDVLWVENVVGWKDNDWGTIYNAAQFTKKPLQNRNRIIGGRYIDPTPFLFHPYKKRFKGVCPTITASEYKGCASDKRRASKFYQRKLTIEECAYHQGFKIPKQWRKMPKNFPLTESKWRYNLYEGIGNGVPPYFAEKFGEMYS